MNGFNRSWHDRRTGPRLLPRSASANALRPWSPRVTSAAEGPLSGLVGQCPEQPRQLAGGSFVLPRRAHVSPGACSIGAGGATLQGARRTAVRA